MTPVTTDKYNMRGIPAEHREHFMLTAYAIRDALRAMRKCRDFAQAFAPGNAHILGNVINAESDLSDALDTYSRVIGNRVGPAGYGDKLGRGAQEDVTEIAAAEITGKFNDAVEGDEFDREEAAEKDAAIAAITSRVLQRRVAEDR